ncbi:MAG: polyprenyl synthetase family protein [Solirubrobacterales bacterium]
MDLARELEKRKTLVEDALRSYLPQEEAYPPVIHQAMRYAVLNGGKRLRPMLVVEGALIAGYEPSWVLPAACAVEMIHSYSLVHDDLPAMDDDELRRGKPTCHVVFGEANAILAGDALLTMAFELLAGIEPAGPVKPAAILKAVREIARAAGSEGMIAGQVVDLASEGIQLDEPTLRRMHRNKTGALIKASAVAGAILVGAPESLVQSLETYAEHFGLAFQITDDILDVEGTEAEIGKPVGSDEKNDKATFVSIHGLSAARSMAAESVAAAIESLQELGHGADFLRALAQSILVRRS